jgi:hypothetical protein
MPRDRKGIARNRRRRLKTGTLSAISRGTFRVWAPSNGEDSDIVD